MSKKRILQRGDVFLLGSKESGGQHWVIAEGEREELVNHGHRPSKEEVQERIEALEWYRDHRCDKVDKVRCFGCGEYVNLQIHWTQMAVNEPQAGCPLCKTRGPSTTCDNKKREEVAKDMFIRISEKVYGEE